MFAPSAAAFNAIAFPIPREAPVMKSVLPASFLNSNDIDKFFFDEHYEISYTSSFFTLSTFLYLSISLFQRKSLTYYFKVNIIFFLDNKLEHVQLNVNRLIYLFIKYSFLLHKFIQEKVCV